MKTKIFYFSATGNSLNLAKQISYNLKDAEVISVSNFLNCESVEISGKIGFVFPVYAWGIPRILRDFIKKADFKNVSYCFAIAGCGAIGGKSLIELKRLLKRKKVILNAGFILKEPSNNITKNRSNPLSKFLRKNRGNRTHKTFLEREDEIINILNFNRDNKLEKDSFIVNSIGNTLNKITLLIFKTVDKNFWLNDGCKGCGLCKNICQRNNISLSSHGKPKWNGNCEYCTGCINLCPREAIEFGCETHNKKRYKNPNITIDELLQY